MHRLLCRLLSNLDIDPEVAAHPSLAGMRLVSLGDYFASLRPQVSHLGCTAKPLSQESAYKHMHTVYCSLHTSSCPPIFATTSPSSPLLHSTPLQPPPLHSNKPPPPPCRAIFPMSVWWFPSPTVSACLQHFHWPCSSRRHGSRMMTWGAC